MNAEVRHSHSIGEIIRSERIAQGLTQEQLAQKSGTSRSTIAQVENSGREILPITAVRIARALDIDSSRLTDEVPERIVQRAHELKEWLDAGKTKTTSPDDVTIPWWDEAWIGRTELPQPQAVTEAGYVLRRWKLVDPDSLRMARINNNDNQPSLVYFDHVIVSLQIPDPLAIGLYYIKTPNGLIVRRLTPRADGTIVVSADAVPADTTIVLAGQLDIRAMILAGFCWRYLE